MNIRKPLFWHDGLFLQPQHLQYTDLYHAGTYHTLQRLSGPHAWGIIRLRINEGGFNNEVCEVEACEILFPEGVLVNYPENAVLSSRSFSSAWKDRQTPFTLYLGIKKTDPNGSNVTVISREKEASAVKTRFFAQADPQEMPDMYGDGPDAQLTSMTYVLKIFWETEVEDAADYELMPVARLMQDGDKIGLSPTFIPPCLHLSGSAVLLKKLMSIRDELAGRIRQLNEYKTPVGEGNTEIAARSIPYRMALQMLSQYAPLIFHFVETLTVHPWHVYGLLRQMIGGISFLSEDISFQGETRSGEVLLPPYNHSELGLCFQKAHSLIIRLLNDITVGAEFLVHLKYDEATGMFRSDVPDDLFETSNVFYLCLVSETPVEEYLDMFINLAKIGSADQVKIFMEHALPGMTVTPLKMQPEGMPRRSNASYFRIDRRNAEWEPIRQKKNIAVIWNDAPEDLRVELIAVKR